MSSWIPKTFCVNNYRSATTLWQLNFEEDGISGSATLSNGTVTSENLNHWIESWASLKGVRFDY